MARLRDDARTVSLMRNLDERVPPPGEPSHNGTYRGTLSVTYLQPGVSGEDISAMRNEPPAVGQVWRRGARLMCITELAGAACTFRELGPPHALRKIGRALFFRHSIRVAGETRDPKTLPGERNVAPAAPPPATAARRSHNPERDMLRARDMAAAGRKGPFGRVRRPVPPTPPAPLEPPIHDLEGGGSHARVPYRGDVAAGPARPARKPVSSAPLAPRSRPARASAPGPERSASGPSVGELWRFAGAPERVDVLAVSKASIRVQSRFGGPPREIPRARFLACYTRAPGRPKARVKP